ncbi:unnamed protein product [Phytomonas sp. EM1]|nr:unnamed protein product [Phytomonas sp. EM1]|eukprot:CCW64016.1 unnamed protein product [Phytomonas sp. isolate EM1]
MTEIDKSKVRLKCQMLQEAYSPGENLTGEVHLDIAERVTFSVLKLNILGVEQISGLISNTFSSLTDKDSLTYLDHWTAFTSKTMNNSDSEALTYDAGCYKFPFSIPLNPALPPSFTSVNTQSYIRLKYMATAIFEISKQYSIVSEAYFRIKSVVPLRQLAAHANCEMRTDFEVHVYRHSCMGWVHGKQPDESVHLSARVDPCIICVSRRDGESDRSKIPFKVRLSVRNNSRKVLKDVDVKVHQITNIRYAMLESSDWTLVAHNCLSKVSIQPGELRELAIEMKMDAVDFNAKIHTGVNMLLPSFSTPFIVSKYIVVVNFPKNKTQRNVSFLGLLNVAEEVSMARQAVRVPHAYVPANLTTEAHYLTHPENISHLEDDMFMIEHQPYIPRPAHEQNVLFSQTSEYSDLDDQNSGEVAEGGQVEEREEKQLHMMGTPIPGHIIRGQVYLSPIMGLCSALEALKDKKKVSG